MADLFSSLHAPTQHAIRNTAAYASARDALLERIVAVLAPDERFVAGWLTGSFGRGEADALSDLNLTLVVTDAQRDTLCARPWMVGAGTHARRLSIFTQFGEPAVIHENHHNAPANGSFTFVLYDNGLMIDWVFVPLSDARLPPRVRVLFAKQPIAPRSPAAPETIPRRIERASERVSYFWMLAAVAAKYRARGDVVRFHVMLDMLRGALAEVRLLLAGEPSPEGPPRAELLLAPPGQAEALRALCREALDLTPLLLALGGHAPPEPMPPIEALLALV